MVEGRVLDSRIRIGAVVAGVLMIVVVMVALMRGGGDEPTSVAVLAQQERPTATAAPERAATPSPTVAPGLRPAAPIALGASAGLSNARSAGLSPPPPSDRRSPPNTAGIARIVSPVLNIDYYIDTLGISHGQMESPDNDGTYAVGWYAPTWNYAFGVPGKGGNAVFSAHETWNHMQGPFYYAHNARIGEDIYLDMENGTRRRYQVISLDRYTVDTIPMGEVLFPTARPASEEWITLITCGGRIVYDRAGYGDYLDRDVLVAKWVG